MNTNSPVFTLFLALPILDRVSIGYDSVRVYCSFTHMLKKMRLKTFVQCDFLLSFWSTSFLQTLFFAHFRWIHILTIKKKKEQKKTDCHLRCHFENWTDRQIAHLS